MSELRIDSGVTLNTLSGYVPYTGATGNIYIGLNYLYIGDNAWLQSDNSYLNIFSGGTLNISSLAELTIDSAFSITLDTPSVILTNSLTIPTDYRIYFRDVDQFIRSVNVGYLSITAFTEIDLQNDEDTILTVKSTGIGIIGTLDTGSTTIGSISAVARLKVFATDGVETTGSEVVDKDLGIGTWQNASSFEGIVVNASGIKTGWGDLWFNFYSTGYTNIGNAGGGLRVGVDDFSLMAGKTLHVIGNSIFTGTIGAGAITGTSFVIGANTLDTNEWAFLDGQDQAVKTTSSPSFVDITSVGNGKLIMAQNTANTYSVRMRVQQIATNYNYPAIQSSGNLYIDCSNTTDTLGANYSGYFYTSGFGMNDAKALVLGAGGLTKANACVSRTSTSLIGVIGSGGYYAQHGDLSVADVDYGANYKAGLYWLMCGGSDIAYNFAHDLQTNPTLFIHSAAQSTTQWISFTHDGTDGVIDVGAGTIKLSDDVTLPSGIDLILSTTTGTKIGTATNQLLGFYNATPVDQPAAVADSTDAASVILRLNELLARIRELGLIAT